MAPSTIARTMVPWISTANDRHGIDGARVGKREQSGEMQAQRAAETEQPEKDRGGAADPAAAEAARLRIPEEFFEECVGHLC